MMDRISATINKNITKSISDKKMVTNTEISDEKRKELREKRKKKEASKKKNKKKSG